MGAHSAENAEVRGARVSDERLDELAALAGKATPGPWVPSLLGVLRRDSRGSTYMDTADAEFIAAAGTDLAALVADLRDARADNQRIREALTMLRDAWNAHFRDCPQPAVDFPAPTAEDIAFWMNAPSDTASA